VAPPSYPIPWHVFFRLIFAILRRGTLAYRQEAQRGIQYLPGKLKVTGVENIPAQGPAVITINHYTRPGLLSWWMTMAISSVVPAEVRWIIGGAWLYPRWLSPFTRPVFRDVARVYNFFSMPPMPPQPGEEAARAKTVRSVLGYAKSVPHPLLAMAPEGRDEENCILRMPPPGAGRFMLHLAKFGLPFYPAGIFEDQSTLCVNFLPPYRLALPDGLSASEVDIQASRFVMCQIAQALPPRLRGEFG
jgi:hypothetical protein